MSSKTVQDIHDRSINLVDFTRCSDFIALATHGNSPTSAAILSHRKPSSECKGTPYYTQSSSSMLLARGPHRSSPLAHSFFLMSIFVHAL